MSLTVMYSPTPRVGQTTLANYLANELGKDDLTLLIEFSNVTGRSLYMNKRTTERRRSLAKLIYDSKSLKENIIQSRHSKLTYFLCLNLFDDFLKMKNYTEDTLKRIVAEAKKDFIHIIIDLPSDPEAMVIGSTLSRNFGHHIDALFTVLDEDAQSYKRLNDFSAVLRMANEEPKDITYIVNKTTCHYVDFIDASLNLPYLRSKNILKTEYFEELVDSCNRGDMYNIGLGRKAKRFLSVINQMKKIVLDESIEGIGVAKSVVKQNKKDRVQVSEQMEEMELPEAETDAKTPKKKEKKRKGRGLFKKSKPQPVMEEEDLYEEPLQEANLQPDNLQPDNLQPDVPLQEEQLDITLQEEINTTPQEESNNLSEELILEPQSDMMNASEIQQEQETVSDVLRELIGGDEQ